MAAPLVEPLEPRIAPAALGLSPSGKKFTFNDVDGDLVSVTTSKGKFLATNFVFDMAGTQLKTLDLSANQSVAGANITFTAEPQGAMGDGRVNVGYIKAATIDLGRVKLPGDLGKIEVGDNADRSALRALTVDSLGAQGIATGAPDLTTNIRGGVGRLQVHGDIDKAFVQFSDVAGQPGSGGIRDLRVTGSLVGGSVEFSGTIFFTGRIAQAVIGGLQGGEVSATGSLLSNYGTLSRIVKMTVGGLPGGVAVQGGAGADSGEIAAQTISRLTVIGDVVGGGGNRSGVVQSAHLGRMLLDGDLRGGSNSYSGEIFGGSMRALHVTGDVVGGTAGTTADGRSGVIEALSARRITVDGSLLGGDFVDAMHTASNSGSISILNNLRSLSIGQDVIGGTGRGSGNVFVGGDLRAMSIGGDFIGASSTMDLMVVNSAYVQAANIERLSIGGDFRAGADGGAGIDTSGAVRAQHSIGGITIGGDFTGDATNPALITAVGQAQLSARAKVDLAIGSVTVAGSATRAAILAGYGTDTTNSLLGEPLNADASIGSVHIGGAATAVNIVAGVQAGPNGRFGDSDDARISGAGTIDRVDLVSRIASVTIDGMASGSGVMGQNFGVVAQYLAGVRANQTAVALVPGASNDLAPGLAIDGSADFRALEVI